MTLTSCLRSPVAALALLVASAACLAGQMPDTLRLGVLQREAEATDRRAPERDLLAEQSSLRLQSIRTERLPSFSLQSQAQHLSDVTSFPGTPGSPLVVPQPYKDQYDASVNIRKRLYDPALGDRASVEAAQLSVAQATLRSALWQQRQLVSDAFFAMLRLNAQQATLDASIADLVSRRNQANQRVTNGAALPSEVLLLEAEIARRRQGRDEVASNRNAARDVLAALTGQAIPHDAVLETPDLAAAVTTVRAGLDTSRLRPEYAQFTASDELIAAQRSATDAAVKPRVSAFVRGGYGRPGLNQLSRQFNTYYQAGVQLEWSPWNWGITGRDEQIQQLQARILGHDEAAFTEAIRRATIRDLATIDQLARSLATDDTIIALRERVLAETRLRFDEGATTSAEYVERATDLLLAQLDRDSHRARLVEARAHVLTTVGYEVR